MTFKAQNVSVDLVGKSATVVAFDQSVQPPKILNMTFPFDPPHMDGDRKMQVVAAAKAVLQQALNEL